MNFERALDAALVTERARARMKGAVAIVTGLVGAGILLVVHQPIYAVVVGLVIVGQGVFLLLSSSSALAKLRGGLPDFWFPSPSHGVVVVAGNRLISSGISVELDRHAMHRVSSVSYDEAAHALKVQTLRIVQTRDGEREEHTTEVLLLDREISQERGYALARELLALSLR